MNLEREESLPLRGTDGTLEAWLRGGEAAAAAPPPPPLRDGDRFGPCRVLGLLGRGGASDVFRAVQEPSGIAVALKVLRPGGGEAAAVRFAREVRLLAEHPHPALPRYLGSGEAEGRPYLLLEELAPAPLPRTDRAVARFLLALCRGGAHLHALGFGHRDIKPDNALFRAHVGERPSGPPAAGGPSIVEGRRVGVGTPGWSAPEQFDRGEATPTSDVHALGVLADACFGGRPPRAWRGIVRRATSSLPAERFPDVLFPRDPAPPRGPVGRGRRPPRGGDLDRMPDSRIPGSPDSGPRGLRARRFRATGFSREFALRRPLQGPRGGP